MLPNNPNPFGNQNPNFPQQMMNQTNPFMMNPQQMQMQYQMPNANFMVPFYNPYQTQPTQNQQQNQMPMQQSRYPYPPPMMMNPFFPMMVPQFYNMMQSMQPNNQHHRKNNNNFKNNRSTTSMNNNEPPKKKSEIDPNDPQHSKDEILKWLEQRKKNYPSKANLLKKELEKQEKIDAGEAVEPTLSRLEQKLRKKIQILSKIEGKADRKRENDKRYLMTTLLNPFKKIKGEKEDDYRNRDNDFDFDANNREGRRKHPEPKESIEKKPESKSSEQLLSEFHDQIQKIERGINEKPTVARDLEDNDAPIEQKCVTGSMVSDLEKKVKEAGENKETGYKDDKRKKYQKPNYVKIKEVTDNAQNPLDIIDKLKKKQQFDDELLTEFLDGKPSADYKYKTNTLMAKLVIDSIYIERNVILQALRYMVRENFFEGEEEQK